MAVLTLPPALTVSVENPALTPRMLPAASMLATAGLRLTYAASKSSRGWPVLSRIRNRARTVLPSLTVTSVVVRFDTGSRTVMDATRAELPG